MYENFKNSFISSLATTPQLNLNQDQINKILISMDKAAKSYDIYEKDTIDNSLTPNGIPKMVYEYLHCKNSEGLSPDTTYAYKIVLELFFKTITKPLSQVEAADIRIFLFDYQSTHNISNRTLDKYREYIGRFFTWAHDYGYIPKNPSVQVKPIHYETKQRVHLDAYELELLRACCYTNRERAIVEFFYSTACRVSELIIVKLEDINFENGTVHLFGKGSKHRTSFLNARARVAVENYLRTRDGESEYLFISERHPYGPLSKEAIEKIIRTLDERCDINKHITPHVLRHTTATLALKNGMPINEISMLLGHSKIETTMIYAKTSYDNLQASHARCVL